MGVCVTWQSPTVFGEEKPFCKNVCPTPNTGAQQIKRPGTLRIISGTAGGLYLTCPKNVEIRPTADRVRESLFNILAAKVPDARVLDIFAGTGAFGIEALSRGAAAAVFVEKHRACAQAIGENLQKTHLSDRARVVAADGFNITDAIAGGIAFDLIFLDPPYRLSDDARPGTRVAELIERLARPEILAAGGMVILEHNTTATVSESFGAARMFDRRTYGGTSISFYKQA